jgi:hypothetical protein
MNRTHTTIVVVALIIPSFCMVAEADDTPTTAKSSNKGKNSKKVVAEVDPPAALTGPGGFTITATIGNLEAGKAKCGITKDAYIELMRLRPNGEKKSTVPQESPKTDLSTSKIVLTAKALMPGQYMMFLQKTYCGGFLNKAIVIPPDAKTPFRLDLGVVDLPVR